MQGSSASNKDQWSCICGCVRLTIQASTAPARVTAGPQVGQPFVGRCPGLAGRTDSGDGGGEARDRDHSRSAGRRRRQGRRRDVASHRRRHADLRRRLPLRWPGSGAAPRHAAWAAGTSWWSRPAPRRRTSCAGWRWPRWAPSTVPTDPAGTLAELTGLVRQVNPRVIVTDAALRPLVVEAGAPLPLEVLDLDDLLGDWTSESAVATSSLEWTVGSDDLAVLIPTSGTTGKSKLVMQTHRAYAMAGVGFPYWMELTAEDRLMTSLPLFHINAPAYSVLGSLAVGAGLVLLPRFSASGFLDSARRHGATEFNAIGAMLEILMRQPVRPDDGETDLRLCYTGPSPAREWQEEFEQRFRPAGRLWLRPVGVAVRADLATRRAAFRHSRLPTPAPHARHGERGPRGRRRAGATSRRERSASCCCATRPSRRATGRCLRDRGDGGRRLAAHGRPRHRGRGRHLHVRLAREGGACGGAA